MGGEVLRRQALTAGVMSAKALRSRILQRQIVPGAILPAAVGRRLAFAPRRRAPGPEQGQEAEQAAAAKPPIQLGPLGNWQIAPAEVGNLSRFEERSFCRPPGVRLVYHGQASPVEVSAFTSRLWPAGQYGSTSAAAQLGTALRR